MILLFKPRWWMWLVLVEKHKSTHSIEYLKPNELPKVSHSYSSWFWSKVWRSFITHMQIYSLIARDLRFKLIRYFRSESDESVSHECVKNSVRRHNVHDLMRKSLGRWRWGIEGVFDQPIIILNVQPWEWTCQSILNTADKEKQADIGSNWSISDQTLARNTNKWRVECQLTFARQVFI